jgi:DNA-binding NarL/FixJ family response regulator
MKSAPKVLLIEHQGIIRIGIQQILSTIATDFEIYEASSKEQAFSIIDHETNFDLILLTVSMPNYSCERMVEFAKKSCPAAKIIVHGSYNEDLLARKFYEMGVDAYLNKEFSDSQLKEAVLSVLANKKYYSPQFLNQIVDEGFGTESFVKNPLHLLSPKEFEVFILLAQGKSVEHIAKVYEANRATIGTYKARLYKKLKVDNLISLYRLYREYIKKDDAESSQAYGKNNEL